MPFASDPSYELGPTLGVAPKDEESRFHAAFAERVEDSGRGVGVWAVVERQRDFTPGGTKSRDGFAEDGAVSIKRAVHGAADDRGAGTDAKDHTPTATFPRTV